MKETVPLITDISQLDPDGTYSYADYLTWRFSEVVELIKGRLLKTSPAPLRRHQEILLNIAGPIKGYLGKGPCKVYVAPFDVRLPKRNMPDDEQVYTVVQPDICIVCDVAKLDDRGCVGAPDMIVEILSPGNTGRDTKIKFDLYEEYGVKEYWIVAGGEHSVAVYLLQDGKYGLAGEYAAPGPVPVQTLPRVFDRMVGAIYLIPGSIDWITERRSLRVTGLCPG